MCRNPLKLWAWEFGGDMDKQEALLPVCVGEGTRWEMEALATEEMILHS